MNAALLLETARAAGLSFEVVGEDIIVETDRDPPPELIAELRQHKAELIAFLTPPRAEPIQAAHTSTAVQVEQLDDLDERAAIIEFGANVPRRWAEGFAALSTMPAPAGFSPERWGRIFDAAGVFLDRWAAEAIRRGWSDLDIFGCDPDRPDARFDCMGLVLLLDRCEVVAVDERGADVISVTGARQRYRRKPMPPGTVSLWQLRMPGRPAA
jgi:hypothetical protein